MFRAQANGTMTVWAGLLAACLLVLAITPSRQARAQDEPTDPPPADAAPADPPAGDSAPLAGDSEESTAEKPRSFLSIFIQASGPIGACLLVISLYFFALIFNLFLTLRVKEEVPAPLVEKIDTAIKERKFQEAYDACKDDQSLLARMVRAGMANLNNGKAEAKEAMDDTAAEGVTRMEAKISYLAVIGTLGPMIGLVGTITGMIKSFREMATAANAQPKPQKIAEGIMEALFLTLEGVALSVPAIFFYAFFRNRIAQIAVEANKAADRVINGLIGAAKPATPPAGAPKTA